MEQLRLFDIEQIEYSIPKFKGYPDKMCAECKDIFAVDHPSGGRKYYCKKSTSRSLTGHMQIRKYYPACFLFKQGSGSIPNHFRSGYRKLTQRSIGVPRLIPRRWKETIKHEKTVSLGTV